MSKQQYAWVLATVTMMRRSTDFDGNDSWPYRPNPLEVERIEGTAGRLRQGERRAANDPVAVLFVLVLLCIWNNAKYRANLVNRSPILCELTHSENLAPLLLQAAWLLRFGEVKWGDEQCHSDHLPTV